MKLHIARSIDEIDAAHWNKLERDENPFLSHEFLHGLEASGSVSEDTGWEAYHLALIDDTFDPSVPAAAAPLYLKHHSWGEYVFDWAWADAYHRAGLEYYPKLLSAIPFTPVTGSRLLVNPDHPEPDRVRSLLAGAMVKLADDSGVSSLHVLFTSRPDNMALARCGLMQRTGNQFHWCNQDYDSFDHYLESFTAAKRKKVRRERRRVAESGIHVEVISGAELTSVHWDAMYRFYGITVRCHGAHPYLNREFFEHLQMSMADKVVMVLARDGANYVGGALNIAGGDALYGRYWGADTYYDGLHFEACYYQPIEYCIRHGLARFEAGAQGEHKLSRGLLPTTTYSAHWLKDPRFRDAVAQFLHAESEQVDRYSNVLQDHTPFK